MATRFRRIILLSFATALILAVVLLATHSTEAQGPAVQKDAAGDVEKLQQERIATLRELVEVGKRRIEMGVVDASDDCHRWKQMLVEAELEAAKTPQQRIAILKAWVTEVKHREELTKELHKKGRGRSGEGLEIKAYRLKIETELARESAK